MENFVFNNADLPQTFLHLEIIENVDDFWPEGITFRDVFVYQMPVTQKLLSYIEEFDTKPVPSWMYLAFPEAKKLLKKRDPLMVLQMDLNKIMRLENQLNPNTIPYPLNVWLKQINDAKLELENIVILDKDIITYTVPGIYCKPTLTFKMSKNFPFEPPIIEGDFLESMKLPWTINLSTLKLYCQRYTESIEPFEVVFEYISSLCLPGARVILVNDDGKPVAMNEMQQLQLDHNKYLVIFCKFLPSDEMGEFYAEVVINIHKYDEHPAKIEVFPKELGLKSREKSWDNENTLEQNLYDCILGEELMLE